MSSFIEPLPGLLDDPQFAIPDLPALTDFHIAPLRNPAPLKHTNAPSPLEPVTANAISTTRSGRRSPRPEGFREIRPSDVLLARESKKPHLAISELLDDNGGPDIIPQQLPSFVSLSVVEKSPIQSSSSLGSRPLHKRPRLEQDGEPTSHDIGRQLPRPAQKELPISRPAPLLPAMVTGLVEPPPSAGLLPSMDPNKRPEILRTASSKIEVKDILRDVTSRSPTPAKVNVGTAVLLHDHVQPLASSHEDLSETATEEMSLPAKMDCPPNLSPNDPKARRVRRKWTKDESSDLLAGVSKHGMGKWKQILDDPDFKFTERSSVDLKDRYRVCSKDSPATKAKPGSSNGLDASTISDAAPKPNSSASPPTADPSHRKERRKRRAWTLAEDDALVAGVKKHGFQWTTIHDDPDLDLGHRRATDLRDRIRNKYPDGYKHAGTAPLRSEIKKAEKQKLRNGSTIAGPDADDDTTIREDAEKEEVNLSFESEKSRYPEKEREPEKSGVTLPSLTLGDDDMDWDNRLPPLLPWDDIG